MPNFTTKEIFNLLKRKSDSYVTSIMLGSIYDEALAICEKTNIISLNLFIQAIIDNYSKKDLEKIKNKLIEADNRKSISTRISKSSLQSFKRTCKGLGINYSAVVEFELAKLISEVKRN